MGTSETKEGKENEEEAARKKVWNGGTHDVTTCDTVILKRLTVIQVETFVVIVNRFRSPLSSCSMNRVETRDIHFPPRRSSFYFFLLRLSSALV